MAAGRVAEAADVLRVDFEFVGVRAHPAHGRLAIVDLRRECRLRRESIADRHCRVAVLGEACATPASWARVPIRHAPPWTTSMPGNGPSPCGM